MLSASRFVFAGFVGVAVMLATSHAIAQTTPAPSVSAAGGYPAQPITLVVAFSAGGAADVVARAIAPKLGALLGTTIVVENKPGANGNIAASFVAKSAPDGYTLLMGFPGLASNPSLYRKMTYDPAKDLVAVKLLANAPVLLVARPGLAANTVPEFVALAKSGGKELNYGSGGQGASGHMAGELFKMVAGIPMVHVPYKGGAPALNDLMGGQIDVIFDSVPSSAPLVQGGKIKALAIAGDRRSETLPGVPTFAEAGLPGYYADTWFGLLAPKGMPQSVLLKLEQASAALVADPAVQQNFKTLGLITNFGTSQDFAAFLQSETAKWAKVVEVANIHLD